MSRYGLDAAAGRGSWLGIFCRCTCSCNGQLDRQKRSGPGLKQAIARPDMAEADYRTAPGIDDMQRLGSQGEVEGRAEQREQRLGGPSGAKAEKHRSRRVQTDGRVL